MQRIDVLNFTNKKNKTKMNLYELTSEQLYINQLLEENGGELTEELMSLMEVNEINFNDKIEGYCKAIKIMESNLTGVESEIERLQKG